VPGEFFPELEKKLEPRLATLLAGKPAPGRLVWSLEKSPQGFGVLWREPDAPIATALAVAPAGKGGPAEIGLMTETHLTRYSASGELLGESPLEAKKLSFLRGADLDGDGKNEWIAAGEESLELVDSSGEAYWETYAEQGPLRIAGLADLDGDGRLETVLQDGSSVVARTILSTNLWKTAPLGYLRSVVPDPLGALLVQTPEGIEAIDRSGRPVPPVALAAGSAVLKGRFVDDAGRARDLFGPYFGADMDVLHDFDGDGRKDLFISGWGGISIYAQDGTPLLLMRLAEDLQSSTAVLADLDGRPGDELVLDLPQYGLVAMGRPPSSAR
jgi:hypothetical protein